MWSPRNSAFMLSVAGTVGYLRKIFLLVCSVRLRLGKAIGELIKKLRDFLFSKLSFTRQAFPVPGLPCPQGYGFHGSWLEHGGESGGQNLGEFSWLSWARHICGIMSLQVVGASVCKILGSPLPLYSIAPKSAPGSSLSFTVSAFSGALERLICLSGFAKGLGKLIQMMCLKLCLAHSTQ